MSVAISAAPASAARTIETIAVQIGSVCVGLEVGPALAECLRQRYGGFAVPHSDGESPPRLVLRTLVEDRSTIEVPLLPHVRLERLDDDRMRLLGDCSASLDLASGYGVLETGEGFVGMDTLVRLSLSLLAPADGWVLFHGAGVELESGGWALLLGASGAGKSTAARAFVSYCDELVLARLGESGVEAASTPYWNGRAGRAPCRALVCLERSEAPVAKRLSSSDAVRALAPHVVRHVPRDADDHALLESLCALAGQVPVLRIASPTGDSYPASLSRTLEALGFAPRWSATAPAGGHFQ